ncbi:MAG: hypothetical protein ACFB6R_11935 [Alphaproteobacteria bacterium]
MAAPRPASPDIPLGAGALREVAVLDQDGTILVFGQDLEPAPRSVD